MYALFTKLEEQYDITKLETDKVAKELLHPKRSAIVMLGPAKVLQPQFASLGTVEVVQPD